MCYFIPRSSTKLSNQSEVRKAGDVRRNDRHGRDIYNAIKPVTLLTADILSGKNVRAWVSIDFT